MAFGSLWRLPRARLAAPALQSLPLSSLRVLLFSGCLLKGHLSLDSGPLEGPGRSRPQTLNSITSTKTVFPNKGTFPASRDKHVDTSFGGHHSSHCKRLSLPGELKLRRDTGDLVYFACSRRILGEVGPPCSHSSPLPLCQSQHLVPQKTLFLDE